jgi:very-short-patch-repair endonuclease
VNAFVGGRMVDFLWPDHRVVVETDGWQTHAHRAAFEDDRARDAMLAAAGYAVVRFTWRQVRNDAIKVVVQTAQVLARAHGTPHPASDIPPTGGSLGRTTGIPYPREQGCSP